MADFHTEFHEDTGPSGNGRIAVEKHGSATEMAHYPFNVTEHGGIEPPKFREAEYPEWAWKAAIECLLENTDTAVSPVFK